MAASDQTYRNQKALDVVFGVSCVLMLVSIVWMFAQDYNREWKQEQRAFRDVEEAMAERGALAKLPDPRLLLDAQYEVDRADKNVARYHQEEIDRINKEINDLRAPLVTSDDDARNVKAVLDSRKSFYDLEVEKNGPNTDKARQYRSDVESLTKQWQEANSKFNANKKRMEDLLARKDRLERPRAEAEKRLKTLKQDFDLQVENAKAKRWKTNDWFRSLPVLDAFNSPERIQQFALNDLPIDYNFKYVTRFDRCTTCHQGIDRPAYDKDSLRALRHDPTGNKLQQAEARIKQLDGQIKKTKDPAQLKTLQARRKREERYADALRDLTRDLRLTKVDLPAERVNEFCAHPRLDLFVAPNSPHPAEKFGCTICHGGQGSATDFFYASHTPDTPAQKRQWARDHDWSANHDWEFPMQPKRFLESGCLKCHHQVTDLIREGDKVEAPKLVRGYNLVRENGCFGCHEIAGLKGGNRVAPDLRLEPNPPLENLSAEERAKLTADPLNPPGTMRKVGPSLYRLSEKTHAAWVRRWIRSPRSFRPTTRMPHFYGLSNNREDVLPLDSKDPENPARNQKYFPDAEIDAIAHYLLYESDGYIDNIDTERKNDLLLVAGLFDKVQKGLGDQKKNSRLNEDQEKLLGELKGMAADRTTFAKLLREKTPSKPGAARTAWKKDYLEKVRGLEDKLKLAEKSKDIARSPFLTDQDGRDLEAVTRRLEQRGKPITLAEKFGRTQGANRLAAENSKEQAEQIKLGRRLFSERGCLACHSHQAVASEGTGVIADPNSPDPNKPQMKEVKLPAIDRDKYYGKDAPFGPNLSMVVEKLGTDAEGNNYESKRRWLIQWILEPTFHSPRTLMPYTHLTFDEAAAVAEWLLAQPVQDTGPDWEKIKPRRTDLKTLQNLARGNLEKFLSREEIKDLFAGKRIRGARAQEMGGDERELILMANSERVGLADSLKWYVGKRAISRLGCFGCHNIPGFDQAKPIGTPLNDWGRKDPERLAFEDIDHFVKDHFKVVDKLPDARAVERDVKRSKKTPSYYERFFFDALEHRSREGFLNQKLLEPRSYDYNRVRDWEDRLRMPQFRFARVKRQPNESDAAFRARAEREEAEAREAVMTFVLGMVGEPIPGKFVNEPAGPRQAEVRGRQVLDKYNCASCHLIRSGTFDFKMTPEVRKSLEMAHTSNKASWDTDHYFPDHNAWAGAAQPATDHVVLRGVTQQLADEDGNPVPVIRLTDAVRYQDARGEVKEVRAYGLFPVPVNAKTKKWPTLSESPAWGGRFGDMLVPYFIELYRKQLDQKNYDPDASGDNNYARASVPPLLNREGEKVQSNWLFQFLRNPFPLRPIAKLRMPRFNMSDEEAMALVNYFGAASKQENPGIGLEYPYVRVRQAEEGYLAEKSRDYLDRLKKDKAEYQKRLAEMRQVWKAELAEQITAQEQRVKEAEQLVKTAKDDADKKTAQDMRADARRRVKELRDRAQKNDYKEQEASWGDTAYAVDGYKLLTSRKLCLNCHDVGSLEASQKEGGPPLALAQERLRPDWVRRWVADPQRFLTYQTIMPVNFPANDKVFQELFVGSSLEQVTAARDILMNLRKVADLPANRTRVSTAPAEGGK